MTTQGYCHTLGCEGEGRDHDWHVTTVAGKFDGYGTGAAAWDEMVDAAGSIRAPYRSLAESMRHQTAKRARTAKSLDKRVARLQSHAETGPGKGDRRYQVKFPDPGHGQAARDAGAGVVPRHLA